VRPGRDEALPDYSRRRDAATDNGFHLTLRTAALESVPQHRLQYYEHAAADPEQTRLILGAVGGALPLDEMYSCKRSAAALSQ
jgi:hypothetical protein